VKDSEMDSYQKLDASTGCDSYPFDFQVAGSPSPASPAQSML